MKKEALKTIDFIIDIEGGYVNDPDDPGGETKYGISKRAYPDVDIANLTVDEAKEIYYNDYWLEAHCHELPKGIRIIVFDSSVNHGVTATIKMLQEAAGASIDGVFGPKTKAAVDSAMPKVIHEFAALRGEYYGNIDNFSKYGHGWMRRLMDVHHRAIMETYA